jgi:hypothetical protein
MFNCRFAGSEVVRGEVENGEGEKREIREEYERS